jgi:hypothetical protein
MGDTSQRKRRQSLINRRSTLVASKPMISAKG